MFGSRRQRQPVQPLTAATANPNAATAAAAVFKRHESNSSLSAAAAAAALAARPMTPTRVSEVQTKRTLRRSASTASSAASSDIHGRPALERRGSNGSMTERSFRSPSPHRLVGSGSGHRQSQSESHHKREAMPPVPALPREVRTGGGNAPVKTEGWLPHRRATSLGIRDTPVRLASQSLGSADAPSWFGAAKVGDLGNVRRTDPAMASPPSSPPQQAIREQQREEGARPSSRASSVNFSYPTRVKVGSPPGSPVDTPHSPELPLSAQPPRQVPEERQTSQSRQPRSQPGKCLPSSAPLNRGGSSAQDSWVQVLVYDPNSRRMVPQSSLRQVTPQQSEQPPSSRRKRQNLTRAGPHLGRGAMDETKASLSTAPTETKNESVNAMPQMQPQIHGQAPRGDSSSQVEGPDIKVSESSPEIDSRGKERPVSSHVAQSITQNSHTASSAISAPDAQSRSSPKQVVKRQPSVVKEEPELESEPDRAAQRVISDALDSVPARQRVRVEEQPDQHPTSPGRRLDMPSLGTSTASPSSSSWDSKPVVTSAKEASHVENPEVTQLSSASERAGSNSPARQAHFGSVSSKLTVRHSPPPRSISPRKSALKQTSPTRGVSPSDDTSETSVSAAAQEEPPVSRKKSVRVSFDDGNTVVVGESAPLDQTGSPVIASPQAAAGRRPWYGSLGRNRKGLPPLEDDEVMKPRPALPSFGSIRDKKPREPPHEDEERPLVRPPADKTHTPATQKSPDGIGERQNNDHAIDAVSVEEHDEGHRNPANISRFREPLPPVVTSIEGSGYVSDSSSGFESEGPAMTDEAPSRAEPSEEIPTETSQIITPQVISPSNSGTFTVSEPSPVEERIHEMAVPVISISQPTPPIAEKRKSASSFFLDVPGGFPQDDSDTPTSLTSRSTTPAVQVVRNPLPVQGTSQASLEAVKEPISDSDSSIYSDAYEDLADMDADGFQSIDAVLETIPTLSQIEGRSKQEGVSGTSKAVPLPVQPELEIRHVVNDIVAAPTAPEDEWEKAKAYWRSLTKEKRAQLEKEAMEEAGIDGDLEEIKPEQKPKKKKSVERRHSERQAVAAQVAQQQETRQNERRIKPAKHNHSIKPGATWSEDETAGPSLQKTLRTQPPPQAVPPGSSDSPRFRKSMRTTVAVNGGEPIQPSWSKPLDNRRLSLHVEPASLMAPGSHRREMSEQCSLTEPHIQKMAAFPPPLRRRGSTSSESSFKRSRPNTGLQVTGFRTSMRPTSASSSQPEKRMSKRFSLRSLSPASQRTSSGPPVSLTSGMQMRHTLRDSSSEGKKSFSLSLNSKKSGKRSSSSKFSSRFADSSDEDEAMVKGSFRSRFDHSSDDDVVSPLALPQPIPSTASYLRNQHSIASTALPEELDESEGLGDNGDTAQLQQEPKTRVAPVRSPAVALANEINLRPAPADSGKISASHTAPVVGNVPGKVAERRNSTRASFMSALRRKRPDSTSKISRREITESAARQDTKLERNLSQLRGIRRASGEVNPEAQDSPEDEGIEQEMPRSPRLQKRVVSLSRSIEKANIDVAGLNGSPAVSAALSGMPPNPSSPAPLSGGGTLGEGGFIRSPLRQPSAASGNLGTRTLSGGSGVQPGLLQRRTMSAGVMSLDASSVAGTSQKKKKFGALRRMFGLND